MKSIKDLNLKLAILDSLWREGIVDPPDLRGIQIEDIEDCFLNLDVAEIYLKQLKSIQWHHHCKIIGMTGLDWGENSDYFHVESFEGIALLENLEQIGGTLFDIDDFSPLQSLKKLKKLNIEKTLLQYLDPLLELPQLKQLSIVAEPGFHNEVIAEKLKDQIFDLTVQWREAPPQVQGKRYYDQIKYSIPLRQQLQLINQAITLQPDCGEYYAKRAGIYVEMKLFERGLNDLNRAIELDGDDRYHLAKRGEIYTALKQYKAAIVDCSNLIQYEQIEGDESGYTLQRRGDLYKIAGKYQEAIDDYQRALTLFSETSYVFKKCYLKLFELCFITDNLSQWEGVQKQHHTPHFRRFKAIYLLLNHLFLLKNGENSDFTFDFSREEKQFRWDFDLLKQWLPESDLTPEQRLKIEEMIGEIEENLLPKKITVDQAIKWLEACDQKDQLLKGIACFETHDPVGLLRFLDQLDYFDFRADTIGKLIDENSEKYPFVAAALHYITAGNCYHVEMHPSGPDYFMLDYIAEEPYCLRSVVAYYFEKRGGVLRFEDECHNPENDPLQSADQFMIDAVLQKLLDFQISIKQIEFHGIDLKELPEIVLRAFSEIPILLIGCSPLIKSYPGLNIQVL